MGIRGGLLVHFERILVTGGALINVGSEDHNALRAVFNKVVYLNQGYFRPNYLGINQAYIGQNEPGHILLN